MTQDVHVKLNPGLPWQKQNLTCRGVFHQQIVLKFKEETSKVLHLEHSIYGADTWTPQKADQK